MIATSSAYATTLQPPLSRIRSSLCQGRRSMCIPWYWVISRYCLPPSVAPIPYNIYTLQECCASDICVGSIMALMCRLIILSKLFRRNDVRLIGLKSFAVVWVAFPALGMKTTFVSRHTVGSSPTARTMWKIFLSQFIASCPACYICYVPVLSRPVPAICMVWNSEWTI